MNHTRGNHADDFSDTEPCHCYHTPNDSCDSTCTQHSATTHEIEGWEKELENASEMSMELILGAERYVSLVNAKYIIKETLTHQQERIIAALDNMKSDAHHADDGCQDWNCAVCENEIRDETLSAAIEVVKSLT